MIVVIPVAVAAYADADLVSVATLAGEAVVGDDGVDEECSCGEAV